jgi:hypothetical protein
VPLASASWARRFLADAAAAARVPLGPQLYAIKPRPDPRQLELEFLTTSRGAHPSIFGFEGAASTCGDDAEEGERDSPRSQGGGGAPTRRPGGGGGEEGVDWERPWPSGDRGEGGARGGSEGAGTGAGAGAGFARGALGLESPAAADVHAHAPRQQRTPGCGADPAPHGPQGPAVLSGAAGGGGTWRSYLHRAASFGSGFAGIVQQRQLRDGAGETRAVLVESFSLMFRRATPGRAPCGRHTRGAGDCSGIGRASGGHRVCERRGPGAAARVPGGDSRRLEPHASFKVPRAPSPAPSRPQVYS